MRYAPSVLLAWTLAASTAAAQEAPPACHQVGTDVVCTAPEFDQLVRLLIDAREAAATCATRLHTCETRPPPVCLPTPLPPALPPPVLVPTQPPRSVLRPLAAVGLAVASGAAVISGALLELPPKDRAALVGSGLMGIGLSGLIVTW